MYPLLTIDLSKIEHNTRVLVERCRSRGIEIIGVTKGCLGALPVAEAMRKGGVSGVGDSRLASLRKLAEARFSPLVMLRQPMKEEVDDVVRLVDVSLISELDIAFSLSQQASIAEKEHSVVVMIESGGLREGILPHEILDFVRKVQSLPFIKFLGIGTNVSCLEGTIPSTEGLELLLELSSRIESEFGFKVPVISGGNSSILKLLEDKEIQAGINQVRVGEGILLGQDTVDFNPIEGLCQDAFLLSAEVIEVRIKAPNYQADAECRRAVLALGRQDIGEGMIKPLAHGAEISMRSSDHLVLNVDNCSEQIGTGDTLSFIPDYFALLAAMTSPFISKIFL